MILSDCSWRKRLTTVETPCNGVNVIQTGFAPTFARVSPLM